MPGSVLGGLNVQSGDEQTGGGGSFPASHPVASPLIELLLASFGHGPGPKRRAAPLSSVPHSQRGPENPGSGGAVPPETPQRPAAAAPTAERRSDINWDQLFPPGSKFSMPGLLQTLTQQGVIGGLY